MKTEKQPPGFGSMLIILESQAELDVLHALVALAGGRYANGFIYKLYSELDKYSSSKPKNYWDGTLHARDGDLKDGHLRF